METGTRLPLFSPTSRAQPSPTMAFYLSISKSRSFSALSRHLPSLNLTRFSQSLIRFQALPTNFLTLSTNSLKRRFLPALRITIPQTYPNVSQMHSNEPFLITLSSHKKNQTTSIKREEERSLQSVTAVVVKDAKKLASR